MACIERKSERLVTERLVLRPLQEADRAAFLRMSRDMKIKKTYMIPDYDSEEQENRLFDRCMAASRDEKRFAFGICHEGALVGFLNDCGVEGDTIELGYFIDSEYWNRGFATEALKAAVDELFRVGFRRVKAGYFEENPASSRVMEKCGLRPIPEEEQIEYRGAVHRALYRAIDRS